VAQQTLALTHLLFWAESSTDPVASLLRGILAPMAAPLVPGLLRNRILTTSGLRLLSGVRIAYRGSRLSVDGRAVPGRIAARRRPAPRRAGDMRGREGRLHEILAGPGVHLLLAAGAVSLSGEDLRIGPRVHVHRLTAPVGPGVVAVRPDGHVGFAGGPAELDRLRDSLSFTGTSAPG
jgi:hypothetical protein